MFWRDGAQFVSNQQRKTFAAGETANLESKEAAINGETKADRAANGDKLTTGEKRQINKEQNKASKNIYNKKHNARTQAGVKSK